MLTTVKGSVFSSEQNNLPINVKDYGAKGDGVTAGDGITATGDIRVFVDDCDTLGNGNLAQTATATINPGAITAGATYSTSVSLPGAKLGDSILFGAVTATLGVLQVSVRVGTTDTVDIEIHNPSGGTITPASATWYFKLKKLNG